VAGREPKQPRIGKPPRVRKTQASCRRATSRSRIAQPVGPTAAASETIALRASVVTIEGRIRQNDCEIRCIGQHRTLHDAETIERFGKLIHQSAILRIAFYRFEYGDQRSNIILAEALLQLLNGGRDRGGVDSSLQSRQVRACRTGATFRVQLVWLSIG